MSKWNGKGSNYIHEVEINTSNVCCGECIICARPHGYGNEFFMGWNVFNTLVAQLKDINFKMIQTSGNGEAFLNPNYLDYISVLRKEFPKTAIWTYNNFSMLNKDRADRIISENLFDRIHVRIDSLQKWIFEKSSNLNQEKVFDNLKYFLFKNVKIPVVILYNNINDYYSKCQNVLKKRPIRDYFTDEELKKVPNEEKEIEEYFKEFANCSLSICRIGHSLWGERFNATKDTETACPKWGVINSVTWVCPNGDVDVCCYDDSQKIFVAGNILKEHLIDIFNGERRKEILRKVSTREWTEYPCTNPKCCEMK